MGSVPNFLLAAIFLALPCLAQDLPDPGRRLSKEELAADPDKPLPARKPEKQRSGPRDPQACERARTYYTISCGAQGSRRDYSKSCSEAHELWRQACS